MSHKPDVRLLDKVVLHLCEHINTPRSLSVYLCWKYDHKSLIELPSLRPNDYVNAHQFEVDYMISSLLTKYEGLETGIDTRSVALASWKDGEVKCADTNKRFRKLQTFPGSGFDPSLVELVQVISHAQAKISEVLGPLKVPVVLDRSRWGPGATFDLRRNSGLDQKISSKITVTDSALRYLKCVMENDPNWVEAITGQRPVGPLSLTRDNFKIVKGNRFLTVPKNAKTDRCISAEPTGNGFLQQGVGRYLRYRLARFGVDLDDQSINQDLAARAVESKLATLDMKAASDTISRELVHALLPQDWAFFLDDLRSHWSKVDGEWVLLEKFSSMGNAFTFELETLIFWALGKSVLKCLKIRGIVSCFGDDLIVPSEAASKVQEIFGLCGFAFNPEKSFSTGLFRESCGKHYFDGHEVTPLYQKSLVNSLPELIRLANRLVRWSERVYGTWRFSLVRAAHKHILEKSKEMLNGRPFPAIPLGSVGDDGFLVPHTMLGRYDLNRGFCCHVLVYTAKLRRANETALLAHKLRHPAYQSSLTTGRQALTTGDGRWVHRIRWIHRER